MAEQTDDMDVDGIEAKAKAAPPSREGRGEDTPCSWGGGGTVTPVGGQWADQDGNPVEAPGEDKQ